MNPFGSYLQILVLLFMPAQKLTSVD